jgi:hypothetical protein
MGMYREDDRGFEACDLVMGLGVTVAINPVCCLYTD